MAKVRKTKIELAVMEKVTQLRLAKGLSQDDIAAILECSRGYIGQIESPNSPSTYNLTHLNRLAYEFECSLHDFLPKHPIIELDWI